MGCSDLPGPDAIRAKSMERTLADIRALADKWATATRLDTGQPSVVSLAFANELYRALDGH